MSRTLRTVTHEAPDQARAGMPRHSVPRVSLDYVTWRARLAAPGSKFDLVPLASSRIVRIEAVRREAAATAVERRTA